MALRDRPLGRQGGDAQPDGPQGRRALGFGARQDPAVQGGPRRQALPDPARELPLVRDPLRARLLHPAAERRAAGGAAHRLRQLRMRLQRRPAAPGPGRGRAHLPPPARLPDRDGGQVRLAPPGWRRPASCSAAPNASMQEEGRREGGTAQGTAGYAAGFYGAAKGTAGYAAGGRVGDAAGFYGAAEPRRAGASIALCRRPTS